MWLTQRLSASFAAQVPQTYLWLAAGFGTGAGLYFALPYEPGFWAGPVLLALSLLLAWSGRYTPWVAIIAVTALGYGWATWMAHWVAEPVISKRMYTGVEGRVVALDRSASDKPRMILDHVVLEKLEGGLGPARVRIALHGDGAVPQIGDHVWVMAHLSPPPGPAEPYGFDFQRHAWFLKLGAVGYTRKEPQVTGQSGAMFVAQARAAVTRWVKGSMPDWTAGVAVAITTGDRSYLQQDVVKNLREANLAHLLAISGLHMGLLAGLIFGGARLLLMASPRGDPKRIGAGVALVGAFAYLMLSGASIATERAFVMTAVILTAVILRTRALTLRAVALAVWIVLLLRPQAIISPGFHMSFAATIALILAFKWVTDRGVLSRPGPVRYIGSAALSAFVAGAATAPFAAAHFNMVPHYGLVANMVAVPLMASVVMPGWIIAVLLTPFGLDGVGFWIMDYGLRAIIWIAQEVASWNGSVSRVKSPGPWVLPLFTIGILFAVLWQGAARWGGGVVVAASLFFWAQTPRPDVLIADSGLLVGVMGPEGRQMSRDKGAGFAARVWLENDGDDVLQADAAARSGPDWQIVNPMPKSKTQPEVCGGIAVVIPQWLEDVDCPVFDLRRLRRTGSVAAYVDGDDITWVTAKGATGRRLWNDYWLRRDARAEYPWIPRVTIFP